MKATDVLREQHREILQLFKRITGSDNGERPEYLDQLIAKLRLHTQIEERIFYPAVQRLDTKRVQEEILESYEEHNIVDYLMTQLPLMEVGSPRFLARVRVLQSLVEEHIEEEETEIFKRAEQLDDDDRRRVDEQIAEELEEVEHVDELLDRAARAAQRTERWAGSLLDAGLALPRRAVSVLAPSRWLRLEQRHALATRIANAVPRVVVDSVYRTVTGFGSSASNRRAA